jgi:hypothetical protein
VLYVCGVHSTSADSGWEKDDWKEFGATGLQAAKNIAPERDHATLLAMSFERSNGRKRQIVLVNRIGDKGTQPYPVHLTIRS